MVIVSKPAKRPGARQIVILLALAVVAILNVLAPRMRPGKSPPAIAAENCNAALWQHVYERERLRIIVPCTTVEGRVAKVERANDGDVDFHLEVADKSLLNPQNLLHTSDDLIVEIVCGAPTTAPVPSAICAGYSSAIAVPKPGDRVIVTGAYVSDEDHGGWREIHPVSRIELLP